MKGWFVRVEETPEGGSYLILRWRIIDPKTGQTEGYDDSVLAEDLGGFFQETGWDIRWMQKSAYPCARSLSLHGYQPPDRFRPA
jgi:hypothetical protein